MAETKLKHMPHHMVARSRSLALRACVCACLLVLVLVYKFSHIMDTAAIFTTAAFVLCEREQRCDAASADSAAFLFCNHISAAVLALFSVCDGVCACVCVKCCPALIFMISFMVAVVVAVSVSVSVSVSAQFQFYVSL